jgi:hypothetical protein
MPALRFAPKIILIIAGVTLAVRRHPMRDGIVDTAVEIGWRGAE